MKYWPLLLIFAAVAGWMVFSARTPTGDEGEFSILDPEQYNEVLAKAQQLTQDQIVDFESGKYLTENQKKKLQDGAKDIKKLIAFEPTNFGPYVMMAKTQRALGNLEEAARNYKQALSLMPAEPKDQETLLTKAETLHDLAEYYLEKGDFSKAEAQAIECVSLANAYPRYLAVLAKTQIKLGKLKEARTVVDTALGLDPNDLEARALDAELKSQGQ